MSSFDDKLAAHAATVEGVGAKKGGTKECTRQGCGRRYTEAENDDAACQFHPGHPVFWEGRKGYSCCKKRVLTFEEFQALPGCSFSRHTDQAAARPAPRGGLGDLTPVADVPSSGGGGASAAVASRVPLEPVAPPPASAALEPAPAADDPNTATEDTANDPEGFTPEDGAPCRRQGCSHVFRAGGEDARARTCLYHPGVAIFHDASKGWSCCRRKVLEFDDFLAIEGCTEGQHRYSARPGEGGAGGGGDGGGGAVKCRHDWYQSSAFVVLSVFAKKADKKTSTVLIEERYVRLRLNLPDGQTYARDIALLMPVDPAGSKFEILSTKVEVKLKKSDARSWPRLEY